MNWLDLPKPILALAPMADLTDSPFCRVCREVALVHSERSEESFEADNNGLQRSNVFSDYFSSKDPSSPSRASRDYQPFVIFREMVSAEAVVRGNKKTLKMCEFDAIEKPIVLQLFGSKPEVMAEAARILAERFLVAPSGLARNDISGIDVNMGCPVPKIAGKGRSGAFLMKEHQTAVDIIKSLKRADLGVPVSVKTRLGWSKNSEILDFAPKLEQAGADAITIHGRTKIQGYSGKADWEMIGRVKKLVSIPIIANGDINSREDIERCLEVTGADGVMIGRGALGRPWVFQEFLISNFQFPNIEEIKYTVLRHAELHLEHYGEKHGLKAFRKHLLYYFKNFPNAKELRKKLVKVDDIEDLEKILDIKNP